MTHLSDDDVRDLPLRDGRAELLEEIMTTPVVDRADSPAPPARRTPAVLAALVAAAAVVAAIVLPGYLLKDDGSRTSVPSSGGPDTCWNAAAPDAAGGCTSPSGNRGLVWAFPRLLGHLDECDPIDASGIGFDDDLPMTFGTPAPGDGSAYRCSLADLGVSAADPGSPVLWFYAFGDDNGRDLRDEVASFGPEVLTLGGERAGTIAGNDVGLVRPDEMFMAVYDDFPFAVIGYANSHDEALAYLAALGMRAPSAMTTPGQSVPALPGFPDAVLQGPAASPSSAADQNDTSSQTNTGLVTSTAEPSR